MEVNFTLSELPLLAKEVLDFIPPHTVLAFHGEMGAGKTTLIQALCLAMGVRDTVSSPTFSIINQYTRGDSKPIWHIDLYRLKSEREAIEAGVEDCFFDGNTCFVEWPERAATLLPENTLHFFITAIDTATRKLAISNSANSSNKAHQIDI